MTSGYISQRVDDEPKMVRVALSNGHGDDYKRVVSAPVFGVIFVGERLLGCERNGVTTTIAVRGNSGWVMAGSLLAGETYRDCVVIPA